jgi:hypothetical protein
VVELVDTTVSSIVAVMCIGSTPIGRSSSSKKETRIVTSSNKVTKSNNKKE